MRRGVAGGNFIHIKGVHRVLLNGLAQQGVHNNELALFPVKRPDEPVTQRKAAELVDAEDRGILIALGNSLQHLVFDLIALLDHGNGDVPLKGGFGEVADIRLEHEGQKLLHFLCAQFLLPQHNRHHGVDGGGKVIAGKSVDAVVVFLHSFVPSFTEIFLRPSAGILAAGAIRPRADHEHGVLFVRHAEQGKLQLKGALGDQQRLLRGVLQQGIAELLPVKLRVQRLAQTVIEIFQPGKGRGHPAGGDIVNSGKLCQHL